MQTSQQNQQLQQQQSQTSINLIEWESSINLDENQLQLLKQLEQLEEKEQQKNTYIKKDIQENLKNVDFDIQQQQFLAIFDQKQENKDSAYIIKQIQQAHGQNAQFLLFVNEILSNLKEIQQHFSELEQNKSQLIQKINDFYKESSKTIEEQKNLIELSNQIKQNLQYFTEIYSLDQEINEIQFDMSHRNTFESILQRFLSQIIDGILFFDSKPNFKDQTSFLESYQKMKKRMLSLIKSFLIKLLNKEFNFINQNFNKALQPKLTDVLEEYQEFLRFESHIQQNENGQQIEEMNISIIQQPSKNRLNFLLILFPQFKNILQDDIKDQYFDIALFDIEPFEINSVLRNLISYLEISTEKDPEIAEIYKDAFASYVFYCRYQFHKELLQMLDQLLQNQKQAKIKNFCLKFINISYEVFIVEYVYTWYIFSYSNQLIIDSIKQHWSKILDSYYEFIRPYILKEYSLDNLFINVDMLQAFVNHLNLINQKVGQQNSFYKKILTLCTSKVTITSFEEMFRQYLEKIRQDMMQRLIQQAQLYIQEKIINFDISGYKKKKGIFVINKFGAEVHTQKSEIFPVILNAVEALKTLSDRIEKPIFQNLACDIVASSLNHLYNVSESYGEKFDSFLFIIKNLILLSQNIMDLGIEFLVKEQELDFTETKKIFLDLISGRIHPNISLSELVSAEKIWNYTTSFFKIIYKGMPKINEFTFDLRKNILKQMQALFQNLNKDMTIIISKNLLDFLGKYQYLIKLKAQIEQAQQQKEEEKGQIEQDLQQSPNNATLQQSTAASKTDKDKQPNFPPIEDVDKNLKFLLNEEQIKKIHILFTENLLDISKEMILKMQNYLDDEIFKKLIQHIIEIQENCLELLNQFFIIISKHFSSEQYSAFQFKDAVALREELKLMLPFNQ